MRKTRTAALRCTGQQAKVRPPPRGRCWSSGRTPRCVAWRAGPRWRSPSRTTPTRSPGCCATTPRGEGGGRALATMRPQRRRDPAQHPHPVRPTPRRHLRAVREEDLRRQHPLRPHRRPHRRRHRCRATGRAQYPRPDRVVGAAAAHGGAGDRGDHGGERNARRRLARMDRGAARPGDRRAAWRCTGAAPADRE